MRKLIHFFLFLVFLSPVSFAQKPKTPIRAQVFGKVGDFNSKYVELEYQDKALVVPRSSFSKGTDLRPGEYVIANPTLDELADERKPAFLSLTKKKEREKKVKIDFTKE